MSAKDIVERYRRQLETARGYALEAERDASTPTSTFGIMVGHFYDYLPEIKALEARTESDAACIVELERERDFEQSSRLTSEAQLGTVISNLEAKLARAEALLAERTEQASVGVEPVAWRHRWHYPKPGDGPKHTGWTSTTEALVAEQRKKKEGHEVQPLYASPPPHPDEALVKALRGALVVMDMVPWPPEMGEEVIAALTKRRDAVRDILSQYGSKP
jgi:hypothetical protein